MNVIPTYRPDLVMIISVPSWWNLSHSSFVSRQQVIAATLPSVTSSVTSHATWWANPSSSEFDVTLHPSSAKATFFAIRKSCSPSKCRFYRARFIIDRYTLRLLFCLLIANVNNSVTDRGLETHLSQQRSKRQNGELAHSQYSCNTNKYDKRKQKFY